MPGEEEDESEMAIMPQNQLSAGGSDRMSPDRHIYFFNTLKRAENFAVYHAEKHPGYEWTVVMTQSVYKAVISEVNRSKYDPKKGLIPE